MEHLEINDKRFRFLTMPNAWLEKLHGGMMWTEGPVYFADTGVFLWSNIPANQMLRWTDGCVTVFRAPSNFSNGNTRDRQGRLVTCEHGTRRVTRTEPDGSITVIADNYQGKSLNSPNDVIVKSDGTIWFSDPSYGIMNDFQGYQAEQELDGDYLFRFDPATNKLSIMADDFVKPNGLCFSPDESILYVADSGYSHDPDGPHHIRAFDVNADGTLGRSRVFAEVSPGVPDGFRADVEGNIWTSAADGVHCYSAQGELLGKIKIPEMVSNLTFGGPMKNRLFITASTSIYSIYVGVRGA